ncbi:oligopeptide ABC transporter periplasmic component [Thiobacillus denitrificans ATCC 25259]|uniref:Oligopeptide ABC transporter periplasmic component n=1 Tax=Thiobacillus denitrificans (strain ATCC 25259 / T1) TaxID=292415 RepID=Q3SIA4_THIDA|nr:ABC transporter substrate-binding protein [Thiobacillus denitrificans]AAZ97624.1 oligopeptide ABC transporter periplasmic component [Thiobacillus denitrificans ATCC 25259]
MTRTGSVLLGLALLAGCGDTWNNPYPDSQAAAPVLYSAFSERPKHLDPARSYSANEVEFTGQIYEPPLQYHFLKRPYTLVPLTAARVPEPRYYDASGKRLPDDAASSRIAESVYEIRVRPGIRYQPHPAFARDEAGRYRYHALESAALDGKSRISDFAHQGTRELVAADYVYQIKRLAHPGLSSPIFGLMSEHIVGLKALGAALEKAAQAQPGRRLDLDRFPLAGAQVVDRYTYRIRIRGKYPQFIYWLAMPFFAPVPWEAETFYAQPGMADRNLTLDWQPVGTGPYYLAENDPNRRMVLKRNPYFHGEVYPGEGSVEDRAAGLLADAGKRLPLVDEAVYSLEKETIPYWSKFLQGYYDSSGISSDSFDQAVRFSAKGEPELTASMRAQDIHLITAVAASIWYVGFNMLDPVVGGLGEDRRKLRQALSIAFDYDEFISIFLNGRGIPAQGPLPPGLFGYVEGPAGLNPYVYEARGEKIERRPIETAKKLLAEAGYPNGRHAKTGQPLVLYFDTMAAGPDAKSRLDWMKKQLDKLNVQLVVRGTDYNRFQDKIRKGNAQLFEWGWNADYPDPENFFFLLYGPHKKVSSGGENAANYDNPEFDRLFERMKDMDNGPERQAVIDAMLEIVRRDAPWIFAYYPKSFGLRHGWVHNVKPNLMANNTLKYRRIDPALREERRAAWNRPVLWPVALLVVGLVVLIAPAASAWRRHERKVA